MEVGLYTISGRSRPLDKGEGVQSKKKSFFRSFGPQFGLKIGGGGAPLDPPLTIESCKTFLISTRNIHHSLSKGLSYSVNTHLCHLEAVLL